MVENEALIKSLSSHFGMNLARVKMMAEMILAMIKSGAIGQYKLAESCDLKVKVESIERRIQRFVAQIKFDAVVLARFILGLFDLPEKLVFIMDRTNWQHGNTDINFLVLAVLINGVAVPVYWELLPHRGNSRTNKREDFMRFLLSIVPTHRIKLLLADREFIGEKWFTHLFESRIPFCIRIRENMLIEKSGQSDEFINFKRAFEHLKANETGERAAVLNGFKIRFIAKRFSHGKLLIIATSLSDNKDMILALYAERWSIESMFKALKTSGFNLEKTHITHPDRLSCLFSITVIAYAFSTKIGIIKNIIRPVRVKAHARPAESIFRYGFKEIKRALTRLYEKHLNTLFNLIFNQSKHYEVIL